MKEQSLSDWIEEKEMRGYYTFTIEEVQKNFPQFGNAYISTSLYRLTIKKKNYFSLERVLCYHAD